MEIKFEGKRPGGEAAVLDDERLEAVSGGAVYDEQGNRMCPECGSTNILYISHFQTCMDCGFQGC